jgi:DNA replication protein DnaC
MGTVDPSQRAVAETLVGRVEELERIRSFLDEASADGGALLVSGDAGVGKTVLLDAAADMALADGSRVLRASGVEFEADVSFSRLNEALLPLSAEFARCAPSTGTRSRWRWASGPAPRRTA